MQKRRQLSTLALALVFVMVFASVAGAVTVPTNVYYTDPATSQVVRADYGAASDAFDTGNTAMWNALRQGLLNALRGGKSVIVETTTGAIDYLNAALDGKTLDEAAQDPNFSTTTPTPTKELKTDGTVGEPAPSTVAITNIAATKAFGVFKFETATATTVEALTGKVKANGVAVTGIAMKESNTNGTQWVATVPDAVANTDYVITFEAPFDGTEIINFAKPALAVSSVSAINATDVTLVLATAPAQTPVVADFAVKANGADIAVQQVAKVDSDLTGKTYKLTIASLLNKEGKLTVNGTEKAFDFKAPEVSSIVTKGPKAIEIIFNEAIKDTTVIAGNFTIKKVIEPNTFATGATKPVLSADGTKVSLTWTDDASLVVADYIFVVGTTDKETATNRVRDVAGNAIYGGTELSFRPTAEQLAVKEAPLVTTAEYNNGTGILVITFNKDVPVANVDVTKVTLGGVALTASDTPEQNGGNGIKITLGKDTRTAVNAVTGALTLVGVKGAWTDGVTATEGQSVAVTKVTPAVITSAAYSQETKVLTVNFDQPVKILDLAKIKVNDANDATNQATAARAKNPDGSELDLTTAKATWNFKLDVAQVTELENVANDKTKLKVYMDEAAVKNDSTKVINNVATTYATGGVAVAYTADATKPYLAGATYYNKLAAETNVLILTFSEPLADASVNNMIVLNAVKIATAATGDENAIDLSNLNTADPATTIALDATKKVLTVVFKGADVADDAETGKLTKQYYSGKSIKVWLAKEVLVDLNGLKNDATTFDTGVVLTFKDFVAPEVIDPAEALNQTYVKVSFDEPVDKTSAETIANYVIKDLAGNALEVKGAVLQANKTTVYLNTAAQEAGKPYKITVSNVCDLQQNLVAAGANTADFFGNSAPTTAKLEVSSLAVTAPVNSKNDTLAITFSAAVNQTQALNLANYAALEAAANTPEGWAAAKAVSLSDANATLSSDGKVVTITLGSYNLQDGKYYKIVVANVTDAYGNALDAAKTTAISAALDAVALDAPSIKEANTKVGAVTLTFAQELNATEAVKINNYKVGAATPAKATYTWDATKGAIISLDLATALTDTADVLIHKNVTNLAGKTINGATYDQEGNTMTKITKPGTLTDRIAPAVKTLVATIGPGAKDDTITITFDCNDVMANTAENPANYVVKNSAGTVIPVTTGYAVFGFNGTAVTIAFSGDSDKAYNLQSGETYTVTISGIVDTSGNVMPAITKTATWADGYNAAPVGTLAALEASSSAKIASGSSPSWTLSDNVDSKNNAIGAVTLNFDKNVKKASANDIALRLYSSAGEITLSSEVQGTIKGLLFAEFSGGTPTQLTGNISRTYAEMKSVIDNMAGATVIKIQIDVFDLAGNKATLTFNIN